MLYFSFKLSFCPENNLCLGSGTPSALQSDETPLAARIIAFPSIRRVHLLFLVLVSATFINARRTTVFASQWTSALITPSVYFRYMPLLIITLIIVSPSTPYCLHATRNADADTTGLLTPTSPRLDMSRNIDRTMNAHTPSMTPHLRPGHSVERQCLGNHVKVQAPSSASIYAPSRLPQARRPLVVPLRMLSVHAYPRDDRCARPACTAPRASPLLGLEGHYWGRVKVTL
ncbi:hypothetical protein B0H13DRAFT_2381333 [Mycena leptocephala]|nr:hypothetical protein B0H13DRAFT_2381333 [Mycena leptocephala]